jgi:hypothetical protein
MSTLQRFPNGEVRTTIYVWEDGSRVDMEVRQRHSWKERYFLFITPNEEEKATANFYPETSPEERLFHLSVSEGFWSKVAGFFLDLGGRQDFAPSSEVSVSIHDSPYPIWMSDDDWEHRVSVLTQGRLLQPSEEYPNRLVLVDNVSESWILKGEWYVYIMGPKDWRFVSGDDKKYTRQVPSATGESGRPIVIRAQSAKLLVDKICDHFRILPESKREWWEKTQVERGTFVIPSPEEVEVFRILEEELPLLWPHETFVPWIEAQE